MRVPGKGCRALLSDVRVAVRKATVLKGRRVALFSAHCGAARSPEDFPYPQSLTMRETSTDVQSGMVGKRENRLKPVD